MGRGEDDRMGARNKDKNSCIPSFISKTYEILEVHYVICRKMNILILLYGENWGIIFMLRTSRSLRRRSCRSISVIRTLPPL